MEPTARDDATESDDIEYVETSMDLETHVAEFDPSPYVHQIRSRGGASSDYLDVKHRLLWLRHDHPDAEIVTELVRLDDQSAIFKATVSIPSGGRASGHGSETAADFSDFIEKAETKALGRALNALGYGAQFAEAEPRGSKSHVPSHRGSEPEHVQQPPLQERPSSATVHPGRKDSVGAGSAALEDYSWNMFWQWGKNTGVFHD
ncbi:hypothetical protein BH23CHL5_BH23CHL5_25760 [soil metagenome]